MDLIILIILLVLVIAFFRDFRNIIYAICIIDIFLRIVTKIETMINMKLLTNIVNEYLPTSILSIINNHSSGIINIILAWIYILIYIVFLLYVIRTFFKKKRRYR